MFFFVEASHQTLEFFPRSTVTPPRRILTKKQEIIVLTKYIIALLALSPQEYMKVAQHNFSASAQHYILGKNSQPHITIVQFMASPEV